MNNRSGSGLRFQVPAPDPQKIRFYADFYAVLCAVPEMALCGFAVRDALRIRTRSGYRIRIGADLDLDSADFIWFAMRIPERGFADLDPHTIRIY